MNNKTVSFLCQENIKHYDLGVILIFTSRFKGLPLNKTRPDLLLKSRYEG